MNWLNVILSVIKAELLVVTKMQYTSAFIRNVFDEMFSMRTISAAAVWFLFSLHMKCGPTDLLFCLHFVFFCFRKTFSSLHLLSLYLFVSVLFFVLISITREYMKRLALNITKNNRRANH